MDTWQSSSGPTLGATEHGSLHFPGEFALPCNREFEQTTATFFRRAWAEAGKSQGVEMSLDRVMSKRTISCSPEIMGGTPVFHGTRMPVQTLLDYLEAGDSIDDFLEGFPSVSRDQVIAFLEDAKERAIAAA